MKLPLLAVPLMAAFAAAAESDEKDLPCFLLDGDKAHKPFPSLTQCYKQNQQACCVSAHDETIQEEYAGHLSGTCVREYPALEQYFCLGCSPNSDSFIEYYNDTEIPANLGVNGAYRQYHRYDGTASVQRTTDQLNAIRDSATHENPKASSKFSKVVGKYGEIKLCASFAEQLMYDTAEGDSDKKAVDVYDGCGLMMKSGDDKWGMLSRQMFSLTKEEATGASSGLPKLVGNTDYADSAEDEFRISHEYKFFAMMRPTYFGKEDFEISWNHATAAEGEDATCFGAASGLQVGAMAMALVALVVEMLA